jgi:hypothetical protein
LADIKLTSLLSQEAVAEAGAAAAEAVVEAAVVEQAE